MIRAQINPNDFTAAVMDGTATADFINSLASAIRLAIEALEKEEKDRQRHGVKSTALLHEMEDWDTMRSLLNPLQIQAIVARDLFETVEALHVRRAS